MPSILPFLLVFSFFIVDLFPIFYPGDSYVPSLWVKWAVFGLAAAYLAWRGIVQKAALPRIGVEQGLLAFAAAVLLSTAFSPAPRLALPVLASLLRGVLVFYILVDAMSTWMDRRSVLGALIALSGLISCLALLETYAAYLNWFEQTGGALLPPFPYRFKSLMLYSNTAMNFLNLVAPLVVAVLLQSKRFWIRFCCMLWIIFFVLALPFSSARSSWLGTAAWMAVLALIWFVNAGYLRRSLNLPRRTQAILLATLVVMIAAAGVMGLTFLNVFGGHPSHGGNPLGGRAGIWLDALQIWQRHPLFGAGTGQTASEYFAVSTSIPPQYWPAHAHSLYLQALSASGLFGFAGFVFIIVLLGKQLRRIYCSAGPDQKLLVGAAIAGLAGWLVHCFFEDFSRWSSVINQLLILLAWLMTAVPIKRWRKIGTAVSSLNLLWVALVLLGFWFEWNTWSGAPMRMASQSAAAGDWSAAAEYIDAARQRDPALSYNREMHGLTQAWSYARTGDKDTLFDAITDLHPSVDKDVPFSLWGANLAVLEWQYGDIVAGLQYMRQALQRAPLEPTYPLNLGVMLETLGHNADAAAAYCQALILRPEWQQHPFWQLSDVRRGGAAGCDVPALLTEPYWQQAQSALLAKDLDAAALHLAESDWAGEPGLARGITRGLLLEAQGRPDEALAAWESALALSLRPGLETGGGFEIYYGINYGRASLPAELVPGYIQLQQDVGQFAVMQKLAELYRAGGDAEKLDWVEAMYTAAEKGTLVGAPGLQP